MIEPVGIGAVWTRFEAWLSAAAPLIAANLRPPADDAALADVETHLGRMLPEELKQLLKIHNGGREVIGGFDLLSAESIVEAYRFVREHAGEAHVPQHLQGLLAADGSAGWIPFAYSVGGDYLCVDLAPGPAGTVGQIFGWNHDDDADPPMARNLTAWLQRVVVCVEAGEIIYHAGREEFLPFSNSAGFALAFQAEPPARFDAGRREVELRGQRSVALRSVESVEPLPEGCRIELVQAGGKGCWLENAWLQSPGVRACGDRRSQSRPGNGALRRGRAGRGSLPCGRDRGGTPRFAAIRGAGRVATRLATASGDSR